jgi:hypothetical protein
MIFRVGMEENNEGYRTIAWALEHPGCYAYGKDSDSAIAELPSSIWAYSDWIARFEPSWVETEDIDINIEDTWMDYDIDENFDLIEKGSYTVEPFFQYDWKPLSTEELERARKMLSWSRNDLLTVLNGLTTEQWGIKKEGERWDIAGIVKHIGGAEWWYMERLGLAFPRDDVPKEPLERLRMVRDRMNEVLAGFTGSKQVVGLDGEFWSPRKVLRRALWHERDHTMHIRKLLPG